MAFFAVIGADNIVENVIIADSLEIANEITGKNCVEYTEQHPAGIGWTYAGTHFIQPQLPITDEADDESSSEL